MKTNTSLEMRLQVEGAHRLQKTHVKKQRTLSFNGRFFYWSKKTGLSNLIKDFYNDRPAMVSAKNKYSKNLLSATVVHITRNPMRFKSIDNNRIATRTMTIKIFLQLKIILTGSMKKTIIIVSRLLRFRPNLLKLKV